MLLETRTGLHSVALQLILNEPGNNHNSFFQELAHSCNVWVSSINSSRVVLSNLKQSSQKWKYNDKQSEKEMCPRVAVCWCLTVKHKTLYSGKYAAWCCANTPGLKIKFHFVLIEMVMSEKHKFYQYQHNYALYSNSTNDQYTDQMKSIG